ncbi:GNAT family N-acetyltransferase [Streptomyces sp. HNM0574]|uniref:GNAT family N-acetyltransferase n=1 Tax=Streptomyces sp. HNM0574 TaxID=2714954 RepID=UPI00146BDA17|nr:GNAT family N-acetyltransferase [Streptomyces sp. HNM0574]NLU67708.1 GNAT family N-acetyltransferase [Streptomyces sp. HNM0574]
MWVRPVRDSEEDAEAVRRIAAGALGGPPDGLPVPVQQAPGEAEFRSRVRHLVRTGPGGGSWIAEDADGRPVGAAQSLVREGTWGLALLAVLPEARGAGVGRALLERAAEQGKGCLRGLVRGSRHPAAARAYRGAGFDLHPTMRLSGTVEPARLATPDGPVAVGGAAQRDLMDSVDRRLRGGAHGPDHNWLLAHRRLLVSDDLAGSGYCYLRDDGTVELLAATSRRLATRLLTAALLSLPEGARATVRDLTAEQQWAVDVGLAAGLEPSTDGWVCVRGMRPPSPYIPSGAFL